MRVGRERSFRCHEILEADRQFVHADEKVAFIQCCLFLIRTCLKPGRTHHPTILGLLVDKLAF